MRNSIIILFFLTSLSSISQDFKFRKVSKEELQEQEHSIYKEANAAVLYRKHNISIKYDQEKGFVKRSEISERIKIYTQKGFEHATKIIKQYNESSDLEEQISGLKAYTYNLENGKIVETKLSKDGIFNEDINKLWKATKFTMPKIKEGCVIEYKYIIRSKLLSFEEVAFQKQIPINKLDFKVSTPEYFIYNTLINPRASFHPTLKHSKTSGKIQINSKTRTGWTSTTTKYNTSNIDYTINIITSNSENIPPLKEELFTDNLDNYKAKMLMELTTISLPNQPVKNLATSWEKVATSIYNYDDFGPQIKKRSYFRNDIDQLLNGATEPGEKFNLIFNHIKAKVKWNGLYGYSTDLGVVKAYKEGVGNIADINLMLVAILQEYGFNANPVLVSTKKNGVPLLPTRAGFNYVICALENNGDYILLDASDIYSKENILPLRALNWRGRLIKKDGTSQWINLLPQIPSKNNVILNVSFDEDFTIKGKVRNVHSQYKAKKYRDEFNGVNKEDIIKNFESKNGEINVNNLEVKNKFNLAKPIVESYDYILDDAVEEIGEQLYFSPLLFFALNENSFSEDNRNLPLDFVYPTLDRYMINIMIPDGYAVDVLPQNSGVSFNGKDCVFSYLIKQSGKMLQCVVSLEIKNTFIPQTEYSNFKQFYQKIIEKQSEKIVLKRI